MAWADGCICKVLAEGVVLRGISACLEESGQILFIIHEQEVEWILYTERTISRVFDLDILFLGHAM